MTNSNDNNNYSPCNVLRQEFNPPPCRVYERTKSYGNGNNNQKIHPRLHNSIPIYLECAEDAGFTEAGVTREIPEAPPEYVQMPKDLYEKKQKREIG